MELELDSDSSAIENTHNRQGKPAQNNRQTATQLNNVHLDTLRKNNSPVSLPPSPTSSNGEPTTRAEAVKRSALVSRLHPTVQARMKQLQKDTRDYRSPAPTLIIEPMYFKTERGRLGPLRAELREHFFPTVS
eukprot:IDg6478t1